MVCRLVEVFNSEIMLEIKKTMEYVLAKDM